MVVFNWTISNFTWVEGFWMEQTKPKPKVWVGGRDIRKLRLWDRNPVFIGGVNWKGRAVCSKFHYGQGERSPPCRRAGRAGHHPSSDTMNILGHNWIIVSTWPWCTAQNTVLYIARGVRNHSVLGYNCFLLSKACSRFWREWTDYPIHYPTNKQQ